MDLAHVLGLVRDHGNAAYGFVFAFAATNSLLVVLFAGYAASLGAFDWPTLMLVCAAGSLAGDAVRFWIGRRFGTGLVRRYARLGRIARLIERQFVWMVLLHRYPQGLRNLAGLAFGISAVSWARFLALNLLSATIWAVSLVAIGYLFGQALEAVLGDAASKVGLVALALFALLAWLLSRSLDPAAERR
jgi:membrane protein DedA with SNARE-associated domain